MTAWPLFVWIIPEAKQKTVGNILTFLEEHLAGASAEVQDTMLRGLTGFLDGNEAGLDWERIAACYAMAGQTLPEKFQ